MVLEEVELVVDKVVVMETEEVVKEEVEMAVVKEEVMKEVEEMAVEVKEVAKAAEAMVVAMVVARAAARVHQSSSYRGRVDTAGLYGKRESSVPTTA